MAVSPAPPWDPDAAPSRSAGSPVDWNWCLDLHQPFEALLEIGDALVRAPQRPTEEVETGGRILNLYLVVCALSQLLDEQLHEGFVDLTLLGFGGTTRRILEAASRAQWAVHGRTTSLRMWNLRRRARELAALSRTLAGAALAGRREPDAETAAAVARLRARRWTSSLRRRRLTIPARLRDLDLYPADCELLATRAIEAGLSSDAPLLVAGLEMAGTHYVAPLFAAALQRLGYPHVEALGLRPGCPLLPADARRLRRLVAAGSWVLVIDDPWQSDSFARATSVLNDVGVPQAHICLVEFRLPSEPCAEDVPQLSDTEPSVGRASLSPEEWHIHRLLDNDAVQRWLNRPAVLDRTGAESAVVLASHRFGVDGKVPAESSASEAQRPGSCRSHVHKLFEVELHRQGERWRELVLGRGVGLGFFGYRSRLIAACLGDRVPDVLGIDQGILFSRWEPGRGTPDPLEPEELDEIAAYVAARERRLGLGTIRGRPLADSPAISAKHLGRLLSCSMGGTTGPGRQRVAEALSCAVAPPRQCVADGRMGPDNWVRLEPGALLKVGFQEHGRDSSEGYVADPAYDLAGASIGFRLEPEEERQLLHGYVRLTGDHQDLAARLSVHKLLAALADLEEIARPGLELRTRADRSAYAREVAIRETLVTRTVNEYLASLFLQDASTPYDGPSWVLDLEGVLETDRLGFASTSPAGVLALRALQAHGQQVLVTTRRSLGEVRERCRTYRLAGGIAEDGAVTWDARREQVLTLLPLEVRRDLARLREALLSETDLMTDPRYEHSIRLFHLTASGRRGVAADRVREWLSRLRVDDLEVIEEHRYTVIRPAGADRVAALEGLRSTMSETAREAPLTVVSGPNADMRLLGAAGRRYVIGNAPPEVRTLAAEVEVRRVSRPAQGGLLQVVGRVLHGRRRRCRTCTLPRQGRADAALLQLLGVQDRGRRGQLAFLIHPATLRALEM